jgi:hypothetical protein
MKFGPTGQFKQELYTAKTPDDGSFPSFQKAKEEMRKVMETFSGRILGSGSECVVVETEKEGFVLAVHHAKMRDALTNKELFYAHKILNTLFPKNFPRVYTSFSDESEGLDGIQGTVREKIIQSELKEEKNLGTEELSQNKMKSFFVGILEEFFPKTDLEKNFNQFALAKKTLEKMGIDIRIDENHTNFIEDRDGNQYYVDTVSKFYSKKSARPKLEKFLDQQNYSSSEKKIALGAFDRLSQLTEMSEAREVNTDDLRVRIS